MGNDNGFGGGPRGDISGRRSDGVGGRNCRSIEGVGNGGGTDYLSIEFLYAVYLAIL